MRTKTILKTLAVALLMPAMMLTTACSSDNDVITNNENINKKGYEIPVTLNATRQGDDATTRATYNPDTRKLEYSTGDQLYVVGNHATAGMYGGALEWKGGIIFGGTITTTNPYEGSGVELLSSSIWARAMLLPAGYNNYHYITINNPGFSCSLGATFATSKATAIEQFSNETVKGYNNGFALAPQNAILNFTLTGLTPNTEITVKLWNSYYSLIQGNVTTNGSGTATFAIGIDISSCKAPATTVDIHDLYNTGWELRVNDELMPPLVTSSTPLEPGHIYNISRSVAPAVPDGAISAVFSVSANKQVYFSKGNLRYASGTWSFFDNQYDYFTSYSADAWDHFGWSTSATTYGMNTSTSSGDYSGDFVDWGATMGSGWRTLTGGDGGEWTYLFNTRSASTVNGTANARYAKAKVNNVYGMILFPDDYTHPDGVTLPVGINVTGNAGWNGNSYNTTDWEKMESAGCVFLPAAGHRYGTTVASVGEIGYYWSSTGGTGSPRLVELRSVSVGPANYGNRYDGYSVRLVRDVAAPAPAYTMAANAVAGDVGNLICTDGHIHAYGADPECTATRVALIAYVGAESNCTHGLAIALEDVSNERLTWELTGINNDDKTAAEWCSAWNTSSKAVTGYTWRLPSQEDWQYMFIGCGSGESYANPSDWLERSYNDLATNLDNVDGTALHNNNNDLYWSSTTKYSGQAAWCVMFNNNGAFFIPDAVNQGFSHYVRACLAF